MSTNNSTEEYINSLYNLCEIHQEEIKNLKEQMKTMEEKKKAARSSSDPGIEATPKKVDAQKNASEKLVYFDLQ